MFFFLPNKKNNWETEKEQVMQEHIAAIRRQLPKEEYEHRQYLGGILKLGVERKTSQIAGFCNVCVIQVRLRRDSNSRCDYARCISNALP